MQLRQAALKSAPRRMTISFTAPALCLFEKRKTTNQFLSPRPTLCLHIERFRKEKSEDAKLRRGGRVTVGMDQNLAKKIKRGGMLRKLGFQQISLSMLTLGLVFEQR